MLIEIMSLDDNEILQCYTPSRMPVDAKEAEAVLDAVLPFIDEQGRITDIERVKEAMSAQAKFGIFEIVFAGLWQQIVEWQEKGAHYLSLSIQRGGAEYELYL